MKEINYSLSRPVRLPSVRKEPTKAEIAEHDAKYAAYLAEEKSKKFSVKSRFGFSRYHTLEDAKELALSLHKVESPWVIAFEGDVVLTEDEAIIESIESQLSYE